MNDTVAAGRLNSTLVTPTPKLRVAFVLAPQFTLVAFAGFVDALRLAADEGDRSRQRLCAWAVLGDVDSHIESSCGVSVRPTAPLGNPEHYDYIVVVGGLLHTRNELPQKYNAFLCEAASKNVKLAGLCTGSFILARAGLLDGHLACVSWFHREEFIARFPQCRVTSSQIFVLDGDRFTCAGGTSVVHLAAHIIMKSIGQASAVKALRIMIEKQPLPARMLQPEEVVSERSHDSLVHKAMLMLEQDLATPGLIQDICHNLNIGRRQLERRFRQDIGLSPAEYRHKLRMDRAKWLLQNTDLNILEVGLECGFENSAHFSRSVRGQFGASPTQVRAQSRQVSEA